jgi:hypothetical protein
MSAIGFCHPAAWRLAWVELGCSSVTWRYRRSGAEIQEFRTTGSTARDLAGVKSDLQSISMSAEHWSYTEWEHHTVEKIVIRAQAVPEEHRADYLRVQIGLAIKKALFHDRSGRTDDDPVVGWPLA